MNTHLSTFDAINDRLVKVAAVADLMGSIDPNSSLCDDTAPHAAWVIKDLIAEVQEHLETLHASMRGKGENESQP
jgi:hypothetical protein